MRCRAEPEAVPCKVCDGSARGADGSTRGCNQQVAAQGAAGTGLSAAVAGLVQGQAPFLQGEAGCSAGLRPPGAELLHSEQVPRALTNSSSVLLIG